MHTNLNKLDKKLDDWNPPRGSSYQGPQQVGSG